VRRAPRSRRGPRRCVPTPNRHHTPDRQAPASASPTSRACITGASLSRTPRPRDLSSLRRQPRLLPELKPAFHAAARRCSRKWRDDLQVPAECLAPLETRCWKDRRDWCATRRDRRRLHRGKLDEAASALQTDSVTVSLAEARAARGAPHRHPQPSHVASNTCHGFTRDHHPTLPRCPPTTAAADAQERRALYPPS